ncbi:MAG: SpoIIE family protein phosphatase [FCB group bacterium]|nr:SpoIIE family protein phosphatase [FCB group bacterium]
MQTESMIPLEDRVFELEKELEAKKQESRDLANIASVITSILDIESVLAVAMETSIRQSAGEVGAILLVEDNDLMAKIAWGVDASVLGSLMYKDNLDIARYCLSQNEIIIDNECEVLFRGEHSIRSLIASPIMSKQAAIGVIVILNKEDGGGFGEIDGRNLEMIGRFTSVAIENANLLAESLEKQKLEHELDLAREVQTTFLPEEVNIPGLKIASTYIPARRVGGDYYDLIPISDTKLFFLLGDVTNKGAPAALVMTSVYSIVRAYITSGRPIVVKEIISHLNNVLCDHIIKGRGMFITLFMACVDLETGLMEYCNGGHPPALFYRASTGNVIHLKPGGPLVGQFTDMEYISTQMKIDRGDRIFCYTDGLIEAEDNHGQLYSMSRLEQFFRAGIELPPERFNRLVKEEIDRYAQGADEDSVDDFTTLIIDCVTTGANIGTYEFEYPSSLDSLEPMYSALEGIFAKHQIPFEVAHPFRVAVSEAVTNAITHAHREDHTKIIRLSIELNDEQIAADINDEGGANQIKASQFELHRHPDAESGRGLGIIKKLSDEVELTAAPYRGATIRIVKYLDKNKSQ